MDLETHTKKLKSPNVAAMSTEIVPSPFQSRIKFVKKHRNDLWYKQTSTALITHVRQGCNSPRLRIIATNHHELAAVTNDHELTRTIDDHELSGA